MDPFRASRLKVKRAKRHISDLDAAVRTYVANEPHRFYIEHNPELARRAAFNLSAPATSALILYITTPPPCELPLIIGDAIHNLRAALDLLACSLVRLNGRSDKNVYFPFSERGGKDFERMIKKRNINRAAPDVVDIIRSLEPYKGGNEALRAIHDLDITDKHVTIVPTLYLTAVPRIIVDSRVVEDSFVHPLKKKNVIAAFAVSSMVMVDDGVVARGRLVRPDNIDEDYNPKLSIDIRFAKGQPFAGESVVPTLYDLAKRVDGIVQTFETHCLGKQAP